MEPLDVHFKDIILRSLYRNPSKQRIQEDIMNRLDTKLFDFQLIAYRKQLALEGLLTEEEPNEADSLVQITPEGYRAIQTFGSYQSYAADQQKTINLQRKNKVIEARYLKLKTISIVITTLLSAISFIAGILLSDRIKELLQ